MKCVLFILNHIHLNGAEVDFIYFFQFIFQQQNFLF